MARKLEAIRCTDEALTICRLDRPVRFQLRGVPKLEWYVAHSGLDYVDTQYSMLSSSYMKGNANNAIIATTDAGGDAGWAIIDVGRNKSMAQTDGTTFPLGTRKQSSSKQTTDLSTPLPLAAFLIS